MTFTKEEVIKLLQELLEKVEYMRENEYPDLRTVIFNIEELINQVKGGDK